MKIVIPVEIDLAMLIEDAALENDVDQATVQAVVASPAFVQHVKDYFKNDEDVWASINNYVEIEVGTMNNTQQRNAQ
jgi:hypothetical protein